MPDTALIALDLIVTAPEARQRIDDDPDGLAVLAASMTVHGLIHPVTLHFRDNCYRLLAGTRRLAAAEQLGWRAIPATIYNDTETPPATVSLAENLCRSDLTPIEEGAALQDLIESTDLTAEAAAKALGRSTDWVRARLAVLAYPPEIQAALQQQRLSLGVADQLAGITDETHRHYLLSAATEHGCTVRQAVAWRLQWQMDAVPPPEQRTAAGPARPEALPPILLQPCFCCAAPFEMSQLCRLPLCTTCAQALTHPRRPHQDAPNQ